MTGIRHFHLLASLFVVLVTCSGQRALGQDKTTEQGAEKHEHTNPLVDETSPYLLMHAHNPVYWYPWNEETLALAKKEKKPIFLSIGYSSCHWCHVMERESFMDEEIAKYMNENFICIKVDREERPDVDAIYMESLHVINRILRTNRGGGWPLSMFLTDDARPFSGGTYFPPRDGERGAKFGFLTILKKINQAWSDTNDRIQKDADLITKLTQRSLAGQPLPKDAAVKIAWISMALSGLKSGFDPQYGGFRYSERNSAVPKFPEPSNLFFLLDQIQQDPTSADARMMLFKTCDQMMMGGIYDHLGGGFHRYSVDRFWAIPHFEKMLYDNGQLATVFSEAYAINKRPDYRWVVEGICDFVIRELRDAKGGFYSALDAESEGEEGKFNRWTKEEIQQTLTPEEYRLFAEIYRLNEAPNFENKFYVPQLNRRLSSHASEKRTTIEELEERLRKIRRKLFNLRERRVRPLTDTKILASWNGLMIRGLADAGRILKNEKYLQAARDSADFVTREMVNQQGRLIRTVTAGQGKLNAYLEDYACVIDGLLALHRATDEAKWLEWAQKIQKTQNELFWDDVAGGYFYTSKDHEVLIARSKKLVDSAMPSGNSVSAGNLWYLAERLKNEEFRKQAEATVLTATPIVERFPGAAPRLLIWASRMLKQ